ncbi:hypothetical protein, conserved [Plasmodium gonderi]|uniref:Uncharacterized protein n=1 Tax=Plasmodium gonderi TaxID=77519 RepID=A0A1Y1JBN9_PLAGO|nr:hypothetical protein, conserved [Plasmodium gonderi]GAW79660.1 hypothetical protein, conserved [Plasmodium gonderi]
MIKRYLKIYPSIYYTKHVNTAPEVNEHSIILKKDYVFNQNGRQQVFLNNKLKKGNNENEIKRIYYFKLWNSLTEYNFTLFENIIQQFLNEGHKYDEVIYSILTHSFILNHRKRNEHAYLVIEEMKRSYMHPAIIKINERMINSFLELEMIFCEPSKSLWINICRLVWETSIKLNRERKRKLKEKLNLLPPNDVLKLTREDLKIMLKKEYEDTLLSMIDTMSLEVDGDAEYEHLLIGNDEKIDSIREPFIGETEDIRKVHPQVDRKHFIEAQSQSDDLLSCNDEPYYINDSRANQMYYLSDEDENSGVVNDGMYQKFMNVSMENQYNNDAIESMDEDENYDSFEDNEDFDIQLLKKYYNFK